MIEEKLPTVKFEDQNLTWFDTDNNVGFKTQIERLGVIAESFIEGEIPVSREHSVIHPIHYDNCKMSMTCRHHPQFKL